MMDCRSCLSATGGGERYPQHHGDLASHSVGIGDQIPPGVTERAPGAGARSRSAGDGRAGRSHDRHDGDRRRSRCGTAPRGRRNPHDRRNPRPRFESHTVRRVGADSTGPSSRMRRKRSSASLSEVPSQSSRVSKSGLMVPTPRRPFRATRPTTLATSTSSNLRSRTPASSALRRASGLSHRDRPRCEPELLLGSAAIRCSVRVLDRLTHGPGSRERRATSDAC